MDSNSYSSPVAVGDTVQPREPSTVVRVARACFWCGVALSALTLLIDFYPGAEVSWCAVVAIFVAAGIIVPGKWYRIGAILLLILLLAYGVHGYQRGLTYQEWLKERNSGRERD